MMELCIEQTCFIHGQLYGLRSFTDAVVHHHLPIFVS